MFKGKKPARYRLVPNVRGNYDLEEWNSGVGEYIYVSIGLRKIKEPSDADEIIAHLNRDVVYYREEI